MAKETPDTKSVTPSQPDRDKTSTAMTSAHSTVSGPTDADGGSDVDEATEKFLNVNELAGAFPFNPNKAAEYGEDSAEPPIGATAKIDDVRVGASTLTEAMRSGKTGSGQPNLGLNPGNLPLDRVRADATDAS
jgi:catalase